MDMNANAACVEICAHIIPSHIVLPFVSAMNHVSRSFMAVVPMVLVPLFHCPSHSELRLSTSGPGAANVAVPL